MSQLDLKTLADNAAAIAYDLAGQAALAATLVIKPGGGVYNPVTDTNAPVGSYQVKGFFYHSYTQELAQDASKTASFLLTFLQLTNLLYMGDINEGDQVIINLVTWTVYRVDPDPVRSTVTLRIRR